MLSFVVPAYNEEESLTPFYTQVSKMAPKLSSDYEIVFVDDGSTDSTLPMLKDLEKKDKRVRVFSFQRNRGKSDALTFAFQQAVGDLVVTLDADLQDRPEEIKKLMVRLNDGYDMVSGWRKDRRDSKFKVVTSKMFNLFASIFWGLKINDLNCGLKLYTKSAAQSLTLYGGMHRFIPILLHSEGFRVTEVPIKHDIRRFGKSKYGFFKVFTEMPDMLTMLFLSKYSKKPLHFFGFVGGIVFFLGIVILAYLSIIHFQGETIGRRPLLFLGMLLVLGGVQVLFTGFLADLIIHLNRNGNDSTNILLKYPSKAK